jgi:uncharacterized protein DUF664
MSHLVKEVPYAADERETIAAMLDQQRAAVVAICDECSDDSLRARPVASDTTILGIVKHLAFMERWWFHDVFAGRDLDYPWTKDDPNAEFRIEENETTQDIIAVTQPNVRKAVPSSRTRTSTTGRPSAVR